MRSGLTCWVDHKRQGGGKEDTCEHALFGDYALRMCQGKSLLVIVIEELNFELFIHEVTLPRTMTALLRKYWEHCTRQRSGQWIRDKKRTNVEECLNQMKMNTLTDLPSPQAPCYAS